MARRGKDEKRATSGTQKQKTPVARKEKELADTRKGNDSVIYSVPGKNVQAEGAVWATKWRIGKTKILATVEVQGYSWIEE